MPVDEAGAFPIAILSARAITSQPLGIARKVTAPRPVLRESEGRAWFLRVQPSRGRTPKQIANALTARGALTPGKAGGWTKGTAWTKGSVRDVLFRELYTGVAISRWGEETYRVEQPGARIIAEDVGRRSTSGSVNNAPSISGTRAANSGASPRPRTARSPSTCSRDCSPARHAAQG